jgi:hypothetical protein
VTTWLAESLGFGSQQCRVLDPRPMAKRPPHVPRHGNFFREVAANMASHVICLSMILVIHDNMIKKTNHIIKNVLVDIFRFQGCKNTTCQYFKGPNWETKGKKRKRTVHKEASEQASEDLVHRMKAKFNRHRQMNQQSNLVAPDELQRQSSVDKDIGWTDGPLVGTIGLCDRPMVQDSKILELRP